MDYLTFLTEVIDRGIAAARVDYANGRDPGQLEGSIAGFNACRGRRPAELLHLLQRAGRAVAHHFSARWGSPRSQATHARRYWWVRTFEAEVAWVCNCVSAALLNQGLQPLASYMPTGNAMMQVARIVGVAGQPDLTSVRP